jgi:hypothetical protein
MAIIDKGKLARYFLTFEVNSPNIKQGSARTSLKDPLSCWRDYILFFTIIKKFQNIKLVTIGKF